MRVAILAGGLGTRLAEETALRPKPMVEIGAKPMLWHIMNIYSAHGFRNFIVACGYRSEVIKDYFRNFYYNNSDWYVDLRSGRTEITASECPQWVVGVCDTGVGTLTAGRLLRLKKELGGATFMATYGDGVGDVDICRLVEFHALHRRLATLTLVRPPARFGSVVLDGDHVREFSEKAPTREGWINGGFFVFDPEVLDYIDGDGSSLEADVLTRLAADGQLCGFKHEGFWQPMDTLREKLYLESLWQSGKAPWKVWK